MIVVPGTATRDHVVALQDMVDTLENHEHMVSASHVRLVKEMITDVERSIRTHVVGSTEQHLPGELDPRDGA